jgi:hypothetical protein
LRLEIIPQSPLSIISKINSKYKKINLNIQDNMIYGMLENLLDFHFHTDIRDSIKKLYKLKSLDTPDQKMKLKYFPIISDICKIESIGIIDGDIFTDYYSHLLYREDGKSHFNSSDKDFSVEYDNYDEKNPNPKHSVTGGKISMFYKSPYKREYIDVKSTFDIILNMNSELYDLFIEKLEINNTAYFGNSDSIVNIRTK